MLYSGWLDLGGCNMPARVDRGDAITARTFNRVIESADRVAQIRGQGLTTVATPGAVSISVPREATSSRPMLIAPRAVNVSASRIEPFRPVPVVGVLGENINDPQFDNPVLKVAKLSSSTAEDLQPFVIALDGIDPGNSGRVCLFGVCPCYVRGSSEKVGFFPSKSTTALWGNWATGEEPQGDTRVIWRPAGTAEALGVVHMLGGAFGGQGGAVEIGDNIQTVGTANAKGGSSKAAAENHVHAIHPSTVFKNDRYADADLSTIGGKGYMYIGGTAYGITHLG